MKRRKGRALARLAAGWLAVAGMAFSGETATLETAHLLYQGKYAESGEGVSEDGGLLLVVAEVPLVPGNRDASRARAMLRSKAVLQDHAATKYLDPATKPPPCGLKAAFPQAVAFGRESVPGLGLPRFDLEAVVRVLEDRETPAGRYRYALALRLADLLAKLPVGLHGEPGQEEVAAALDKAWRRRERDGSLPEMCLAFGLVEDWLRLGGAAVGIDWPGAPWLRLPSGMDARTLAANWEKAAKLPEADGAGPEELQQALAGAPLLPGMLQWLEGLARRRGKPEEAVLWRLWQEREPGISGESRSPVFPSAFLAAAAEYDRLWGEWRERPEAELPFPGGKTVSPLMASWRCFGHADFAGENRELPSAYRTAQRLYDQGKDIDRIVSLAAQSAEAAPGHPDGWALLGQALFARGETVAAIPFLTQALWLAPGDADTRAFLALAYRQAGCPALALGLAASARFAGAGTEWSRRKADELLAGTGGKENP